jgi:hypothetical protein
VKQEKACPAVGHHGSSCKAGQLLSCLALSSSALLFDEVDEFARLSGDDSRLSDQSHELS